MRGRFAASVLRAAGTRGVPEAGDHSTRDAAALVPRPPPPISRRISSTRCRAPLLPSPPVFAAASRACCCHDLVAESLPGGCTRREVAGGVTVLQPSTLGNSGRPAKGDCGSALAPEPRPGALIPRSASCCAGAAVGGAGSSGTRSTAAFEAAAAARRQFATASASCSAPAV